jgi:hypothetical protein
MTARWAMRIAVLMLVAAFGCKNREGSTGTGSAGSDSTKPHRAGNCPSTVSRATTTATIEGNNVLVTITSDDPDAIAAVQKRTDELLAGRMEHHAETGTQHEQNGEHGGAMGLCPVYVPEGATATAQHVANGVVVSIAGQNPASLKTEIDGRIQRVADWVKANIPSGVKGTEGGLGGGKNNEGMNRSGKGDGKGMERRHGDGQGSGAGTGGGGGHGTGGGGSGSSATP